MTHGIDVLLISPAKKEERPYYLPLGLLSIASYLRKNGISVKIFDINTSNETIDEIIQRYSPKSIGITALSGPMLKDAVKISCRIRELNKNIHIIWGGIHPTIFPALTLKNDYVDFVVMQEGEITTLELVQSLDKPDCYKNIRGIGYKIDGKTIINPERKFIDDLDTLPMPAWDLVDVKKYFNEQFWGSRILTLNTSRGCRFRCAYCQNQIVTKRTWRGLSARRIIESIAYLKATYGIDGIHFMDDDFNSNISRTIEYLNILKEEKLSIKWFELSRVNHYQDLELVKLRGSLGCKVVDFGVESGSERILKFIQKDQTIAQIKTAFNNCKVARVVANALIMIGLPTETEEDVRQTVKLLREIPHLFCICGLFKPYPGNKLFDYVQKNNNFKFPVDLVQLGELLSYNDSSYNFSKIDTMELLKIKHKIDIKNVFQYLKINLYNKKYGLILKKIMAGQTRYLTG